MEFLYSLLYAPFGFLFRIFFQIINNYGLALFLFSLFFRLILIPNSIKQQKSTAKTGNSHCCRFINFDYVFFLSASNVSVVCVSVDLCVKLLHATLNVFCNVRTRLH